MVHAAMVHACFEVDANATAWLSVSKDLLPVMRGADYELSHLCLGILLARVFKQELKNGTVTRKQGALASPQQAGTYPLQRAQDQGRRARSCHVVRRGVG